MIIFIKKVFYLLIIISLLVSCNRHINKEPNNKGTFLIKTFKVDSLGWGYDICKNEKIIIHQTNIPAISGNNSFKTEKAAYNTAKLVIKKLKKNIFPPSLTKEEVESVNK